MNTGHWAAHIIIPVFHQAWVMNGHFLDSPKCEMAATQEQGPLIIQLLYKSNENSISEYKCEKKQAPSSMWERPHHSEKVSGRKREVTIAEDADA